jgi:hypothetical protein
VGVFFFIPLWAQITKYNILNNQGKALVDIKKPLDEPYGLCVADSKQRIY